MKPLIMLSLFGSASLLFSACQNYPRHHPDDFGDKTHRTYNPQTGSFEQSPPWGKQSNKTNDNQ